MSLNQLPHCRSFPGKALFIVSSLFLFSTQVNADHNHSVENEAHVYTFGVVPQFEQRKLFRIWRPVLDELENKTGLVFRLKGSAKIPDFENEFMAGNYDFSYMNPYHMLAAHNRQGYIPLVRDGDRLLKGVLTVRKDSAIKSLEDLNNKIIAFPAPNALAASLLMRADLTKLKNIKFIPRYVKTHSSVYLNVVMGLVDAGGGVFRTLDSQKDEVKDNLRVLYTTREMSPHPISVHPRVPKVKQEKVRQALLDMSNEDKGKELLSKIPIRKAVYADIEHYSDIKKMNLEAFWVD